MQSRFHLWWACVHIHPGMKFKHGGPRQQYRGWGGLQDNNQRTCGTVFPCLETLSDCRNYLLHVVDKHLQSAAWWLALTASEWTMVPALMGLIPDWLPKWSRKDGKGYSDSAPKVKFIEVNIESEILHPILKRDGYKKFHQYFLLIKTFPGRHKYW